MNRVYTDKPVETIEKLKSAGVTLANQLFVPVDNLNTAAKNFSTKGTPQFEALKQLNNIFGGK